MENNPSWSHCSQQQSQDSGLATKFIVKNLLLGGSKAFYIVFPQEQGLLETEESLVFLARFILYSFSTLRKIGLLSVFMMHGNNPPPLSFRRMGQTSVDLAQVVYIHS